MVSLEKALYVAGEIFTRRVAAGKRTRLCYTYFYVVPCQTMVHPRSMSGVHQSRLEKNYRVQRQNHDTSVNAHVSLPSVRLLSSTDNDPVVPPAAPQLFVVLVVVRLLRAQGGG